MNPERYEQIKHLFYAALELPAGERAAFLARSGNGDGELRRDVERMLAGHERAEGFLSAPATGAAAELILQGETNSIIGRVVGHYRIVSQIGAGGMGEVYLAEDTMLDRPVAIKLLPADFTANPERVARFEREAKAASALNHPNIITIHEIGKVDGLHFIATEYIEGETLRRRIADGGMEPGDALDVAIQIAAALAAAHEAGIIHRDIKPENVMLRPDGYAKVLDFGLAKLTQQAGRDDPLTSEEDVETKTGITTATGVVLGTAAYMSPEQARGLKVDARSDIWSLGVVLYEMATGVRPFTGQTSTDVLVSILERQPPPLSTHLPQTDSALERIVARALQKDVAERYSSIRQFSHELKELKRRIELEAELKQNLPPDPHEVKTAEQRSPLTVANARPKAISSQASEPPASNRKLPRAPVLALAAIVIAGSAAAWLWLKPATTSAPASVAVSPVPTAEPDHQLNWWLQVQKMIGEKTDGNPYQSSGRNEFPSGWKFRFNLNSPRSGFLYLINEGLKDGGEISYNLLFPTPRTKDQSAAIEANQTVRTGLNRFDENEGTEKFWIVWAANPVPEIEAVRHADNFEIKGPDQIRAIQRFLNAHAANSQSIPDDEKELTTVRWRGDVMVDLVKLKHR
jgi:serine/threonine protein kinase